MRYDLYTFSYTLLSFFPFKIACAPFNGFEAPGLGVGVGIGNEEPPQDLSINIRGPGRVLYG